MSPQEIAMECVGLDWSGLPFISFSLDTFVLFLLFLSSALVLFCLFSWVHWICLPFFSGALDLFCLFLGCIGVSVGAWRPLLLQRSPQPSPAGLLVQLGGRGCFQCSAVHHPVHQVLQVLPLLHIPCSGAPTCAPSPAPSRAPPGAPSPPSVTGAPKLLHIPCSGAPSCAPPGPSSRPTCTNNCWSTFSALVLL